jgi:hypothetical protein
MPAPAGLGQSCRHTTRRRSGGGAPARPARAQPVGITSRQAGCVARQGSDNGRGGRRRIRASRAIRGIESVRLAVGTCSQIARARSIAAAITCFLRLRQARGTAEACAGMCNTFSGGQDHAASAAGTAAVTGAASAGKWLRAARVTTAAAGQGSALVHRTCAPRDCLESQGGQRGRQQGQPQEGDESGVGGIQSLHSKAACGKKMKTMQGLSSYGSRRYCRYCSHLSHRSEIPETCMRGNPGTMRVHGTD